MASKKKKFSKIEKPTVSKPLLLFVIGLIALITYIAFSPSLKNGFTNWDDPTYVLENPLVVNNKVPVKEIFKTPVSANYHPITMLTLAWNYQSDKLNPEAYHQENVFFHILNTCLVFFFIFLITQKNLLMAAIVALLFGVHPMHVESVSWISERKDVLYVFFFLAGLITYFYYRETKKIILYLCTLILFILSCLSKGMAVVFPVILLLMDYLSEVKWERKIFTEKIPFFLISLGFGIAAVKIQSGEAITNMQFFTLFQRIEFASYGAVMYIVKFVFPYHLSAYYPYPTLTKTGSMPIVFHLSPFILLSIILGVYFFLRKEKALVFGLLFYFVSVALVLQFISVGTVVMADRYSYLSYIGLAFIIAFYVNKIWISKSKFRHFVLGLTGFVILVFSFQTYARTQVWKNSDTLWTDVIQKENNSTQIYKAYVNRGRYFHSIQQDDKALQDYNSSIKLYPYYDLAYNNRGNIFKERGKDSAALADYNKAIAIDPTNYLPYSNRANIYRDFKENQKALADFSKSISLNPNYWANYYNRGLYDYDTQNDENAIADFSKAIQLNYIYVDLYYRRGMTYVRMKRFADAINDFSIAIQINPNVGNYWLYRSYAENAIGNKDAAQRDLLQGKQLLQNR
ncbi:MAG TPA: tetratricopeptide repeat protein [Bacteroidia bacterium]|nr:tetratricopeptide repeat protein [Bacteroidia bacterium]